jgi:hypothetical protein
MLSVVEISSRIQNPNLVVPDDLSTLQELSTKYPYTQLFSILYLKALSKAGDPRFEEELSRHSYRISDRVQLYELIQNHDETESLQIPTETVEAQIEIIQESEVEVVPIEKSAPTEEIDENPIPTHENDSIIVEPEPEPEPESESESEAIVFEPQIEQSVTEVEPEPIVEESKAEQSVQVEPESIIEETKIEPQDNLEESILHHVYAANYRLDDLTDAEEKAIGFNKESSSDQTKIVPAESSVDLSKTKEEPIEYEQGASSFTGWLHSNNNYAERDTSDKEAINAVVEDFSEFDPSSELFGEVEKPKTEFFSPAKKAKKSLEESELPVSETLAKIYIMQGNYPQAISAYKQLSLAFPEKKIFFANLIEDLEKKINT